MYLLPSMCFLFFPTQFPTKILMPGVVYVGFAELHRKGWWKVSAISPINVPCPISIQSLSNVYYPLRSDSRQGILGMTRGPTEELIFCLEMDNIYFIFLRLLFFLWSLLFFGCWCLLNFSCAPILAPNGEWVQWRRFFWLSHYVKGEARAGRIGFSVNSDCL